MAILIPKTEIESISNKAERDVAKALVEKLPDNVTIFHSYPWMRSDRNAKNSQVTIREGEVDFVIVIPELGFLILEVKGGEISYDKESWLWYSKSRSGEVWQIKDPFKQASKNTHVLKDRITRHVFQDFRNPPCAFGYAVIFPDCDYVGTSPPGSDKAIILSFKDIQYIERRIPEILRKWSVKKSPIPLTKVQAQGVKEALKSTFSLIPILSREIDEDEERLIRLTEEQIRVLEVLENYDRCCIEGVAGSGKTILAMEQAKRFAEKGLRTLFVCYNRTLAKWVKKSIPSAYEESIDIYHFHGLCNDMCRKADISFKVPDNGANRFFQNEAPILLYNAFEKIGSRYDAVIVDEGQDFDSEWWLPLEMACHKIDRSPFCLFYDPAQNLFVDRPGLPDLGKPFVLKINCRNTRRIANVCSKIKKLDIKVHDSAPEGKEIMVLECPTPNDQLRKCEKILIDLKKGGIKSFQIVIQSPHRQDNEESSFKAMERIGGFPIVTDIEKWRSGLGILFTTIRSFKGLEADVVIMVDLIEPKSGTFFTINDLYVGASRAKHILAMLGYSSSTLSNFKESE